MVVERLGDRSGANQQTIRSGTRPEKKAHFKLIKVRFVWSSLAAKESVDLLGAVAIGRVWTKETRERFARSGPTSSADSLAGLVESAQNDPSVLVIEGRNERVHVDVGRSEVKTDKVSKGGSEKLGVCGALAGSKEAEEVCEQKKVTLSLCSLAGFLTLGLVTVLLVHVTEIFRGDEGELDVGVGLEEADKRVSCYVCGCPGVVVRENRDRDPCAAFLVLKDKRALLAGVAFEPVDAVGCVGRHHTPRRPTTQMNERKRTESGSEEAAGSAQQVWGPRWGDSLNFFFLPLLIFGNISNLGFAPHYHMSRSSVRSAL
jgi:hypothetical protein